MHREPGVEEVHTVTGDACILMKGRRRDAQALEDLLARVCAVEGVGGTRSTIALPTDLEHGPQAEVGQDMSGR